MFSCFLSWFRKSLIPETFLNIALCSCHSEQLCNGCFCDAFKSTFSELSSIRQILVSCILHYIAQNVNCLAYFSSFKSSFKWSELTDPCGSLRNDWIRVSIPAQDSYSCDTDMPCPWILSSAPSGISFPSSELTATKI